MNYKIAKTVQDIQNYLGSHTLLALDIETSPMQKYRNDTKASLDSNKSEITGISLSVENGTGIYIPLRHRNYDNADFNEVFSYVKNNILLDESKTVVIHNAVFESSFFYALGVVMRCKVYDTMAAAQLTLKTNTEFRNLADSGLKKLVPELLKSELPTFEAVTERKFFDELSPDNFETVRYVCADSDYALRLYHVFNKWFDENLPKHRFIVEEIESPIAVYVGLMKHNGIKVDIELMLQKNEELTDYLLQLREDIRLFTGGVNIGKNTNTREFKDYLYKQLNLPTVKTTYGQSESVDDEAIMLLEDYCKSERKDILPLFGMIREYRELYKIKSTYIEGFLKYYDKNTNKIHPDFWQLGAESGRFCCKNPNFQNLKSGMTSNFNVRDFVIPPTGKSIIEADYSQVELKIAAYLSQDKAMIQAYKNKEDIHAVTTSAVFGISIDEAKNKSDPQYKKRRTVAKSTIFGVLYGIYKKGLQRNLKTSAGIDLSVDECGEFIKGLKDKFSNLAFWQRQTVSQAKETEYVETKFGRRRYLPYINSTNFKKRSSQERIALNHGVQGLAAECLKLSMTRLTKILHKYQYLKPILTVHDSLVFICPDEMINQAAKVIKECMEVTPFPDFDITLNAEVSVGKSYGRMKEMEAI